MTAHLIDVDIQPEPPGSTDNLRDIGDRIRAGAGNATPPPTDDVPPAFAAGRDEPKPPSASSLQGRLEAMYATIAIAAMPFDPAWANEIMMNAPVCAEAWMSLARENNAVRKMLERLLTVSATGAVIAAHLPIIITAPGIRDRLAGTMFTAMRNAAEAPTQ